MESESIPLIVVRLRGAWSALDRIDPRADPSLLLCVEAARYAILVAAQWSASERPMEWRHSLAQDAIETALALERAAAALIEKGPGAAEIFDSAMQLGNTLGERLAREGTLPLVSEIEKVLRANAEPERTASGVGRFVQRMGLAPSPAHAGALAHALTRTPASAAGRAWRRQAGAGVDDLFLRWLTKATREGAQDTERRERQRDAAEHEKAKRAEAKPWRFERSLIEGEEALTGLVAAEDLDALRARLAVLSPRERDLAEAMIDGDGDSKADAARSLGMRPSTARTLAERIRKKLRRV